ncbi:MULTISPECIES: general stress protein [Corynebacterium]|uniref:DUF3341 domain-containing protein n=2 Tax=Corynebacterium TaxID=1716 RepID=A0A934M7N5_9CORY|nr:MULTISPECIES: general stress protein [Corynebacterium]MBI8989779.1 DUF3341 domain-containing protein [Corynebacterium meridianum]MBV7293847.1 DUF3341 domain-containing protein [Corynebacterium sp. TAE3-ERU16]MCK7660686.1 DUF3341 domain-containing protein [Corynebacterium antarcticum]MCK7677811.1 DUF3341 domain-containing protein [Corynebacterium meridianum]MCL0245432.1 DUF3341 domain-containing protein [Corynebacterium antarcticum]
MSQETTNINQGEVAVFDSLEAATEAVRKLGEAGFPIEHVSVITQNLESTTEVHGFINGKDVAKSDAKFGAWFGGIFGLLSGSALLLVPGVGPVVVAGSLAAALAGGVEGAAAFSALGGVVGAVTGHFVAKKHLPKLTEHLTAGRFLLVAQSADEADLERAREILGADNLVETS